MESPTINHLAIIMDGNRRWAKAQGLPTLEGHRRGYQKLKDVGSWCIDRGIKLLTVYAFSTENWNRSQEEVSYLMDLLKQGLTLELPEFKKRGIRLRVIGSRDELSQDLRDAIEHAQTETAGNDRGTLNIALNYGGRLEIVRAVQSLIEQGKTRDEIDEAAISGAIWTADQPDPDLIIRTSGEQRLSGFLTWQSVYSELLFIDKHWPAFEQSDLDAVIEEYANRQRRFGK